MSRCRRRSRYDSGHGSSVSCPHLAHGPETLRLAASPGTTDHTRYGLAPASPRDFYTHHLAAVSAAVTHADAVTVLNEAATLSFFRGPAAVLPAAP